MELGLGLGLNKEKNGSGGGIVCSPLFQVSPYFNTGAISNGGRTTKISGPIGNYGNIWGGNIKTSDTKTYAFECTIQPFGFDGNVDNPIMGVVDSVTGQFAGFKFVLGVPTLFDFNGSVIATAIGVGTPIQIGCTYNASTGAFQTYFKTDGKNPEPLFTAPPALTVSNSVNFIVGGENNSGLFNFDFIINNGPDQFEIVYNEGVVDVCGKTFCQIALQNDLLLGEPMFISNNKRTYTTDANAVGTSFGGFTNVDVLEADSEFKTIEFTFETLLNPAFQSIAFGISNANDSTPGALNIFGDFGNAGGGGIYWFSDNGAGTNVAEILYEGYNPAVGDTFGVSVNRSTGINVLYANIGGVEHSWTRQGIPNNNLDLKGVFFPSLNDAIDVMGITLNCNQGEFIGTYKEEAVDLCERIIENVPAPILKSVFTDGNISNGATPATFNRASIATVQDFEGVVKDTFENEARFKGLRRVENMCQFSENMQDDYWLVLETAQKIGNNNVIFPAQSDYFGAELLGYEAKVGDRYRFRATVVGTGTLTMVIGSIFHPNNTTQQITLNGNAQTFSIDVEYTLASTAIVAGFVREPGDTCTQAYFNKIQVEKVSGQSNTNPSEYISRDVISGPEYHGAGVDGVKYFNYENGNTVDGVTFEITEANGADLDVSKAGILLEDSSTNLALQSESFNSLPWTTVGVGSITQDAVLAPDGSLTADEFSNNVGEFLLVAQPTTDLIGKNTLSVWLKSKTGGGDEVLLGVSGFANSVYITNEWKRYEFVMDIDVIQARNIIIGIPSAGEGFYAWGLQVERRGFSSSYLATEGVSISRSPDSLSTPSPINSEGTLFAGFRPLENGADLLEENSGSLYGTTDSRGITNEVGVIVGNENLLYGYFEGGGTYILSKDDLVKEVYTRYSLLARNNSPIEVEGQVFKDGSQIIQGVGAYQFDHSNENFVLNSFDGEYGNYLISDLLVYDIPLSEIRQDVMTSLSETEERGVMRESGNKGQGVGYSNDLLNGLEFVDQIGAGIIPVGFTAQSYKFADNGNIGFVFLSGPNSRIARHNFATPYDFDTISTGNDFDFGSNLYTDVEISPDGTKMLALRYTGAGFDYVFEDYTLSTPFDPSTAILNSSSSNYTGIGSLSLFAVDNNLDRVYVVSPAPNQVIQFNMPTPYSAVDIVPDGSIYNTGIDFGNCNGIAINSESNKVYISNTTSRNIYSYEFNFNGADIGNIILRGFENVPPFCKGISLTNSDGSFIIVTSAGDVERRDTIKGFHLTNATLQNRLKLSGFLTEDVEVGEETIVNNTVIRDLSGLIDETIYYVQDTPGEIGTVPGTIQKSAGVSFSDSELLINQDL